MTSQRDPDTCAGTAVHAHHDTAGPTTPSQPHQAIKPWSLRHAVAAPFALMGSLGVVLLVATVVLALAGAAPRADDQVGWVVVNSACMAVAGLVTAWGLGWWKNRRRPRAADFAL